MTRCKPRETSASSDCTERTKSSQRGASVTPLMAHTKVIPQEPHVGMKHACAPGPAVPSDTHAKKAADVGVSLIPPHLKAQGADLRSTKCDRIAHQAVSALQAISALDSGAPLPGISAMELFDPLVPSNSPIQPKRLTEISSILAAVRQVRLEEPQTDRET